MSEYKLDLSNCTNELPPKPITHEMFNKLIKQRDQYKAEREKFEQMLNEECERGYQMEGKYYDIKSERDTLIDDIAVLKANISRLERQNAEQLALLKEFRKLIDYKLSLHQGSSMYREYRSKLDQLGVK